MTDSRTRMSSSVKLTVLAAVSVLAVGCDDKKAKHDAACRRDPQSTDCTSASAGHGAAYVAHPIPGYVNGHDINSYDASDNGIDHGGFGGEAEGHAGGGE